MRRISLWVCAVLITLLAVATTANAAGSTQVFKVPFKVNAQAKADIAACVG